MPSRVRLLLIESYVLSGGSGTSTEAKTPNKADKTAVTVTFSQYFVEAGPGINASQNRKNCQLTLLVKYDIC